MGLSDGCDNGVISCVVSAPVEILVCFVATIKETELTHPQNVNLGTLEYFPNIYPTFKIETWSLHFQFPTTVSSSVKIIRERPLSSDLSVLQAVVFLSLSVFFFVPLMVRNCK